MAFNVYMNPYDVTMDGVSVVGVQSISVSTQKAEIHAAGDSDTHESVARHGTARTGGTITMLDPTNAYTIQNETGDLVFKMADVKGGTAKTVTIASASIGGYNSSVGRDTASTVSIPFIAESAPVIS